MVREARKAGCKHSGPPVYPVESGTRSTPKLSQLPALSRVAQDESFFSSSLLI